MALTGTSWNQFTCELLDIDVDCPDVNKGDKVGQHHVGFVQGTLLASVIHSLQRFEGFSTMTAIADDILYGKHLDRVLPPAGSTALWIIMGSDNPGWHFEGPQTQSCTSSTDHRHRWTISTFAKSRVTPCTRRRRSRSWPIRR